VIDYTDVAMLGFVKTMLPTYTVCWAPPESTDKALADARIKYNQAHPLEDQKNTRGIPGATVFRTGEQERTDISTLPQATLGWPMGKFTSGVNEGDFSFALARHVSARYVLIGKVYDRSDVNFLCRKLWFSDVYKCIDVVIQGNNISFPVLRSGAPVMSYKTQQDTGKILEYTVSQAYDVYTLWAESAMVPPIDQIVVTYQDLIDGAPVTLEEITILKNP
jgi:hypothetical protein